jgi:hypothetical protein
MTPATTMSQKIASNSIASEVPFTRSMMNMLGDRLRNVPKNCQFQSPFESRFRLPWGTPNKGLGSNEEDKAGHIIT